MKPLKLIVVVGSLTMLAAGCTNQGNSNVISPTTTSSPSAAATATPDEFAATRIVFKENCSKCHGDSGDGGPVTVDGKKLRVPSFKTGHALKHTDEDFVDQIKNGGDGMPVFKDKLKPEQVNDLVHFIRKDFQGK